MSHSFWGGCFWHSATSITSANAVDKCATASSKLSRSEEEEDKPIQNVAILLSRDKATPLWRSTPSSPRNQVHYGLLGSGALYLSVHYGWSYNCLLWTVIQGRGTSMADYEACLATEDWWPTAQMTTRGVLVRLCALQRQGVSGYLLGSPQRQLKQQVMNHTDPLSPTSPASLDELCGNYRGASNDPAWCLANIQDRGDYAGDSFVLSGSTQ